MAKVLPEMSIFCFVTMANTDYVEQKKVHTIDKSILVLKIWKLFNQGMIKNLFDIIEKEGSRSSGDVKLNQLCM